MADDSVSSAVLDDEGRLFGLINVVDALVVLLVVAISVAGISLVVGGSGASDTRYATIDLGAQPDYTVDQIRSGDVADVVNIDQNQDVTAEEAVTITDVYMYPTSGDENGGVNVIVRAAVDGRVVGEGEETAITVAGEPLRFGRELQLETVRYVTRGTVVAVSQDGPEIATEDRSFVVEATVDRSTAENIAVGDEYRVGETPLLTIETVNEYPTGNEDRRRVIIGVTAQARLSGEQALVGDRSLLPGTTVPIQTEDYELTGQVIRAGSLEEPGVPASRELTLEIDGISPSRANSIRVGMTESVRDVQTAEVLTKNDQPAERVVESGGNFVVREHPRDRDVTLTVAVNVRERDDGTIYFRGKPLRLGTELQLEFASITVSGEVTDIQ